jgi:electron transfer flavoprotein beta subunit
MLRIVVCVKQVPITDKVSFDWKRGGVLIRENLECIMNPDDIHAIELALQLKEQYGGEIVAISMGPPQAEEVLREALALGVDRGILITDDKFKGSDTLSTTKILHNSIIKLGKCDIIITGFKTIDGSTAQVSYQLSELFKIPHITQIHKIEIKDKTAIVERLFGHEYQTIKVDLPIILAVNSDTNKVRHVKLFDIKNCINTEIVKWKLDDLEGKESEFGLKGSTLITLKGEIISHKRKQQIFTGTIDDKVDKLISKLKKYGVI